MVLSRSLIIGVVVGNKSVNVTESSSTLLNVNGMDSDRVTVSNSGSLVNTKVELSVTLAESVRSLEVLRITVSKVVNTLLSSDSTFLY